MRSSQWGLDQLHVEKAWKLTRGRGVVVAVLDSGVDFTHPDLRGQLMSGVNFVTPGTAPQDDYGHGTHVAGIIAAAKDNGVGIAGVAPQAKIMPIKVGDAGGAAAFERVVKGIRYAADHGADVINMSLSQNPGVDRAADGTGLNDELHAALEHAWKRGVVIVASAGNLAVPFCSEPAASNRVLCVGALGPDSQRSWYSQGDATMTDWFVCAPGGSGIGNPAEGEVGTFDDAEQNVLSTVSRGTGLDSRRSGYVSMAGTSMAAPHVAGVAALLLARGLKPSDVVPRILSSAQDLGAPGRDPVCGSGAVDAAGAVSLGRP